MSFKCWDTTAPQNCEFLERVSDRHPPGQEPGQERPSVRIIENLECSFVVRTEACRGRSSELASKVSGAERREEEELEGRIIESHLRIKRKARRLGHPSRTTISQVVIQWFRPVSTCLTHARPELTSGPVLERAAFQESHLRTGNGPKVFSLVQLGNFSVRPPDFSGAVG